MVQVNYYSNFKNWYLFTFYIALITIFVLSIIPHKEIIHELSTQHDSFFINIVDKHTFISKVAYAGENLFGYFSDKIRHFIAFMTLGLLLEFAYINMSKNKKITALIAYGTLIETIQFFIPYRKFGLDDMIFNTVSILFYFKISSKIFIIKEK